MDRPRPFIFSCGRRTGVRGLHPGHGLRRDYRPVRQDHAAQIEVELPDRREDLTLNPDQVVDLEQAGGILCQYETDTLHLGPARRFM